MICVRGAISAEENSRENILENTRLLLEEILRSNYLGIDDIISVVFTCTKDLDAAYPAVAARELGMVCAALMCVNEMYVENSMSMCIRVMVTADVSARQISARHVYLKEAKKLRPDLAK